ncbi:hypothetical protein TVAG_512510, partial [Trichomonas vaginalis G3]
LPSDIPSSSIRQKKFFHPTRKNFPDNWKKFSCCPSVNHSNFRKLRTFFPTTGKIFPDNWKKISRQLEKNFLPTFRVLPSNRKKISRQQEKFFLPTGHKRMSHVPLPECLPKPEEPTAPAPQQTY